MGEKNVAEWIMEAEENEGLSIGEWTDFIKAVKSEKRNTDDELKRINEVVQTTRDLYRNQYNENLRLNKDNERLKTNISNLQEEIDSIDLEGITQTIDGFKKRVEELNLIFQEALHVH